MARAGRRKWVPTEEEMANIRLWAGYGSTQEQIAAMLGRSVDTLKRNPAICEALAAGKAEIISKVAGQLVTRALAGNMTAAIFYLKTQAGWKEREVHEHVGADGGPIAITPGMTAKEAAELYRAELG